MILSHTERQQLEEVRARSQAWQKTGETTARPEQLQHDIYFLLLILAALLEQVKEGDRDG